MASPVASTTTIEEIEEGEKVLTVFKSENIEEILILEAFPARTNSELNDSNCSSSAKKLPMDIDEIYE